MLNPIGNTLLSSRAAASTKAAVTVPPKLTLPPGYTLLARVSDPSGFGPPGKWAAIPKEGYPAGTRVELALSVPHQMPVTVSMTWGQKNSTKSSREVDSTPGGANIVSNRLDVWTFSVVNGKQYIQLSKKLTPVGPKSFIYPPTKTAISDALKQMMKSSSGLTPDLTNSRFLYVDPVTKELIPITKETVIPSNTTKLIFHACFNSAWNTKVTADLTFPYAPLTYSTAGVPVPATTIDVHPPGNRTNIKNVNMIISSDHRNSGADSISFDAA